MEVPPPPQVCDLYPQYTSNIAAFRAWRKLTADQQPLHVVYHCHLGEHWHVGPQGEQDPLPLRPRPPLPEGETP